MEGLLLKPLFAYSVHFLLERRERERKREKLFYWAFGKFYDAESVIIDMGFQILYLSNNYINLFLLRL
jgi:hypothetical protein